MERYKMITNDEFAKATLKFDEIEKRGSFYDMAVNLIDNNFEIEAYFLILATWNFALFRYAVKDFDIGGFKKIIKEINPYFDKLQTGEFRTLNFDQYEEDIKKIYNTLSPIKGVKYTGASKIMHLKNRNVFVMWDGYIQGNKPQKYYNELEIVKKGVWEIKNYGNSADDYFLFLKEMQKLFKNINFQNERKTFAKAIDEFNYVNITLPIQEMGKKRRVK